MAAAAEEFEVIIIGAGPAGLAAEFNINKHWVNKHAEEPPLKIIIIEKEDVTAPLWRYRTYDNVTLQCRKEKCALPGQPFPDSCPDYPRRSDFIEYLDVYETKLKNKPHFNTEVTKAVYSEGDRRWKITTQKRTSGQPHETKMYSCVYLVVASGLNARPKIPGNLDGLEDFFPANTKVVGPEDQPMKRIHAKDYKNGEIYKGKKVLVVGSGDSGIDICGDLHNKAATPYIVVNRLKDVNDDKSVNKRTKKFYKEVERVNGKIDGSSKTNLSKLSEALKGNRGQCNLGNIDNDCKIEVYFCSNIVRFHENSVKLLDRDDLLKIDCVILATGYDHNVNEWFEDAEIKFNKEGEGELIFDKTLGDDYLFKRRISAVGFNSKSGLHGLKKAIEVICGRVEKEVEL